MSVIFKKQKEVKIKRRKPVFAFLTRPKKKDKDIGRVKKARFKSLTSKMIFVFALFVVLSIVGFSIYTSVGYLAKLKTETKTSLSGQVVGFDNIPSYPDSEFVFQSYQENQFVRKFLSQGKSIYRLPPKTSMGDVYTYYKEKLKDLGWEYVLSVPYESEEQRYGEYWVKDGKGLRISGKYNDVWYESMTITDAKTGLRDEVKKEAELKLLLVSKEFEDLRPDYPWRLQVPSEYLISYLPTDMGELMAVQMKKAKAKDFVLIYPIGYTGGLPMDTQLDRYLEKVNKSEKTNYKVISSIVTTINTLEGIKASISNGENGAEAYVVGNSRNNVNYVIFSSTTTNPLLKYITEKIDPARKSYFESE